MTESVEVVYHEDNCKINLLSSVQSEENEFPTVLYKKDEDTGDGIEVFTENEIPVADSQTTITSSPRYEGSEYCIISHEVSQSPDEKPVESQILSYSKAEEDKLHEDYDNSNIIDHNEITVEESQTTISSPIYEESDYHITTEEISQSPTETPVQSQHKNNSKNELVTKKLEHKRHTDDADTKKLYDIDARTLINSMNSNTKTANPNSQVSSCSKENKKTYFIPGDISQTPEEGPVQPRLPSYPKSMHGGTKPQSFCASLFDKFPWLEYSVSLDKVYCFACRHFSDQDFSTIHKKGKHAPTVYATTGFCVYIKAHERMQRHNCSAKHLKAMEPWLDATIKREMKGDIGAGQDLCKVVEERKPQIPLPSCNVDTTSKRKCSERHLNAMAPWLKKIKQESEEKNKLHKIDSLTSQAKNVPKIKFINKTKSMKIAKINDKSMSSELRNQKFVFPNRCDRTLHSSWCNCTKCKPMLTKQESICCSEIGVVKSKLKSVEGEFFCITEHPGFNAVCLNSWVLQTAYYNMKKDRKPRTVSGLSEKYRHTAYAQFATWCWGSLLGEDYQAAIPSCVIYAVRKSYQSSANCRYPPLDDL